MDTSLSSDTTTLSPRGRVCGDGRNRTESEIRHPENCFPVGTKVHILDEPYPSLLVTHGEVVERKTYDVVVKDEFGEVRTFRYSSDKLWLCRRNFR